MCGGVSVYTRNRVLDWIDNHICPVYVDDGNVLRFRCIHSWHRWAFICTWELLKKTMIATVGDPQNGCENIIIRTARHVLCQLIIVPIYCQRDIFVPVFYHCATGSKNEYHTFNVLTEATVFWYCTQTCPCGGAIRDIRPDLLYLPTMLLTARHHLSMETCYWSM